MDDAALIRIPESGTLAPALAEFAGADTVRRRGVIFRAGHYPDQQFTLTAEEIKGLARSFNGPVPIDHGHPTADGPIDFGRLVSVEASDDGSTLYGVTETPAWLEKAVGGARWLVSASFHRLTKGIRRLSLVTRPQISDAELQAAFAQFCACQANPTPKETPMEELTPREQRALAALRARDDEWQEGFVAEMEKPDDAGGEGAVAAEETESNFSAPDPKLAEALARIAELEAARAADELANFAKTEGATADAYLDRPHTQARIIPAIRPALRRLLVSASLVDRERPINFNGGGGSPTMRADLEEIVSALPVHGLTEEGIRAMPADAHVLPNGRRDPADFAAAEQKAVEDFCKLSPLGQAGLAIANRS